MAKKEKVNKFLVRAKARAQELANGEFVYVVKCGIYYKIGMTNDIRNRMNILQCGNPYEIQLVWAVRKKNAKYMEEGLHEALAQFNHRREWFILNEEFVSDLKEFVEKYED